MGRQKGIFLFIIELKPLKTENVCKDKVLSLSEKNNFRIGRNFRVVQLHLICRNFSKIEKSNKT